MIINKIQINKNQYLGEIMTEIPSNRIVLKTLTGIGATHLELNSKRHSIIIEPNVPVILGKRKKGALGVCEGVYRMDIVSYLKNDDFKYKKILVTPESYAKVIDAIKIYGANPYEDFFLMYDECDRTAKDIDFRDSIIKPMDDFFLYKEKTFISATASIPSDPRFKDNGFEILVIEPTFDYSKDITLIKTNNAALTFNKRVVSNNAEGEVYFIFLNSTRGIYQYITQNKIELESAVFASEKALLDIRTIKNLAHCSDKITKDFKKYNFFTSRFYAAVDIILEYRPHVVMITDFRSADHTMIDPKSDAIQIVGRFRNGVSAITAITNNNDEITALNPDESDLEIVKYENCYRALEGLRESTDSEPIKEALTSALIYMPFSSFLFDDGTTNHFMIDNFKQNELTKSYYIDQDQLSHAYQYKNESVKHFNVLEITDSHESDDKSIPVFSDLPKYKDKVSNCIELLNQNVNSKAVDEVTFNLQIQPDIESILKNLYPEIIEGYHLLGAEKLKKIGYTKRDVIIAIKEKHLENSTSDFGLIDSLHLHFSDGQKYTQSYIISKFEELIKKHQLTLKPTLKNFMMFFFEIGPRTSCAKNPNDKCRMIKYARHTRQN